MSDLVVVKDTRKLAEISLPSFPGSKVSMVQDLLLGDVRRFNHIADPFERAIEMMLVSIKDWNLAEEKEDGSIVKMSVSKENVDKFPQADIELLLATSQNISVDELRERGKKLSMENLKKNIAA